MQKNSKKFVKGMGAGMLAGMTVALAGTAVVCKNKKTFKKRATKAANAIGDFVDSIKS